MQTIPPPPHTMARTFVQPPAPIVRTIPFAVRAAAWFTAVVMSLLAALLILTIYGIALGVPLAIASGLEFVALKRHADGRAFHPAWPFIIVAAIGSLPIVPLALAQLNPGTLIGLGVIGWLFGIGALLNITTTVADATTPIR